MRLNGSPGTIHKAQHIVGRRRLIEIITGVLQDKSQLIETQETPWYIMVGWDGDNGLWVNRWDRVIRPVCALSL